MTTAPSTPLPASGAASASDRVVGIDWLRGLVMVIMMLDHTRDFVHAGGLTMDPLDPATSTAALYFTRWITHLCAPAFVLLAGLAAGLQMQRAGHDPVTRAQVARFLAVRGLWLIGLELVVVQWLIAFTVDRSQLANLQVIWAIGISMLVLAGLCRLSARTVFAIGLIIVLGHNLLDGIRVPDAAEAAGVWWHLPWALLHQQAFLPIDTPPRTFIWISYPALPWIGVMCLGFGAAGAWTWPRVRRARWLLMTAAALGLVFVLLRLTQAYGDPLPWKTWPSASQTVMDVLDVQKYPPSLLFLCITLAPSLVLLAWAERRESRGGLRHHGWLGPLNGALITLGRVPLFFYLCQWLLAHLMGIGVSAAQGYDLTPYFLNGEQFYELVQRSGPPAMGGPLWLVYLCWATGLLMLWPVCRWFARLKTHRTDWWWLRFL